MRKLFVILLLFVISPFCRADNVNYYAYDSEIISSCQYTDTLRFGSYNVMISYNENDSISTKRSKLLAVFADILAGPLGGHRIYLGTEPWIPVVYALTLGGGIGFLPVTDLFVIIFTRDLEKYINNPKIIMWL